MEQPKQGELVWIYYFNPSNRHGSVTVSIAPRQFDHVIPNYLGKLGLRWVLVIPGTPYGRNYGVAHRPENVYETKEVALVELSKAVKNKIVALEDALAQTIRGGGMA
jgi:hypothetical protein